ncbi:hypothetical protein DY000_02000662 [Brassica cretica]|uniref:Uncharacterized protein n=1 Tax=Brassica cretica TaxID=69181 RepID=A0ABQ7BWX9_BRACR|nr:hypothetical protein DY000_02000662 [Brassica cretica]
MNTSTTWIGVTVGEVNFVTFFTNVSESDVLRNNGAIPWLEMTKNVLQDGLTLESSAPRPPLFDVEDMIVHMNHPSEYSSHARFEETLLDHLIHSPIGFHCPALEEVNSTWPSYHVMLSTGRVTRSGIYTMFNSKIVS